MRAASNSSTASAETGSYPILQDAEFDFLRLVVGENAGIKLGPNKRQLVQGRIARRMRELGLGSYEAYCNYVREAGPEELVSLINALTTNVTSFFRENHHFDALSSYMLPEALKRNAASRRLRIWSAGCSTGEEPYCIAMVAAEQMPSAPKWDFKILATDIDSDVIAEAQRGVYRPERVRLIAFRSLNLMREWPMRGPFDIIFCRNVMIYFDQPTRERLIDRFAQILAPGGYLCIGHSESIHGAVTAFRSVGKTIYKRQGELRGS